MTLDRYASSSFENLLKQPLQVGEWVHQWRLHPNFFLGNLHVKLFLREVLDDVAISALRGSNITMPYLYELACNNRCLGLLL